MSGPATEALEQANKRQRISLVLNQASGKGTFREETFDLDDMFHAITPGHEEDFPSIGWDFDEETEAPKITEAEDSDLSALLGQKRRRDGSASSGLLRSKSFSSHLSLLSVASQTTQRASHIQKTLNFKPIQPEEASEKVSFDPLAAACKITDDFSLFALKTTISSISRTNTIGDAQLLKDIQLSHNQPSVFSVLA